MIIELVDEFKLADDMKSQIIDLVQTCFREEDYRGRIYFKQKPHYRLLLKEKDKLIAQLGFDFRAMVLAGNPINVLGIIDLTVQPDLQGKGYGTMLLKEAEKLAIKHSNNIDFLFLVSEKHEYYMHHGYTLTKQTVKWLAIDNHNNFGMKENFFDNLLLYKPIGNKVWIDNSTLDMLGYWY